MFLFCHLTFVITIILLSFRSSHSGDIQERRPSRTNGWASKYVLFEFIIQQKKKKLCALLCLNYYHLSCIERISDWIDSQFHKKKIDLLKFLQFFISPHLVIFWVSVCVCKCVHLFWFDFVLYSKIGYM